MMKFKYNVDCTFEEKIQMVSKEIIDEYPEISLDDAVKIAAFTDPIDKKVTDEAIFKRYYYMLLLLDRFDPVYAKVYNDMLNISCGGLENELYNVLADEIRKYIDGEISEFPVLSKFYDRK